MVNFNLTEREKSIVEEARAFAEKEITPNSLACKEAKNKTQRERFEATLAAYQAAVKSGFMKYAVPEEYGGKFKSCLEAAIQ